MTFSYDADTKNEDANDRVFVVRWSRVGSADGRAKNITFAVRLWETSGFIDFQYGPDGEAQDWTGLSYTCGIEDPSGTARLASSAPIDRMAFWRAKEARTRPSKSGSGMNFAAMIVSCP